MPGRDAAPAIPSRRFPKEAYEGFPDGLYVSVSRIEDLYIVQSSRPVRVVLPYTAKVVRRLLEGGGNPLPFGKGETILSLDPFFPQADEERLAEDLPKLIQAGYRTFIVNNLGHFAFFRGTEARVAAGPYLYTFNRYAYDLVNEFGTAVVVTPLENSRQNLDKTVEAPQRKGTAVTVFAYPALFRIRADLSSIYDFSDFTDGRGETFTLLPSPEGSLVVPSKPFSIVDKIPFLKEAGFGKFILDFTGPALKKRDYKDVMDAAKAGAPLPNTQRFNWKDGFYAPQETAAEPRGGRKGSGSGRPREE
jgi:putative protease